MMVIKGGKEHLEYILKTPRSFYYGSEYFALGNKIEERYSELTALLERPEHLMLDTFGFRKNFTMISDFSDEIWRVREMGVIDQLRRKYLAILFTSTERDEWTSLTLYSFATPFLFLGVASAICSIACFLETLHKTYIRSIGTRPIPSLC